MTAANTNFCIFTGNSNPDLAHKIGEYLKRPLCGAIVNRFSDGEIQIEIDENVRSKDVFVIQSTCDPVNDGTSGGDTPEKTGSIWIRSDAPSTRL